MKNTQKKYTKYRQTLAWIGFIAMILGTPILLALAVYGISQLGVSTYDREARDPAYQVSEARQI